MDGSTKLAGHAHLPGTHLFQIWRGSRPTCPPERGSSLVVTSWEHGRRGWGVHHNVASASAIDPARVAFHPGIPVLSPIDVLGIPGDTTRKTSIGVMCLRGAPHTSASPVAHGEKWCTTAIFGPGWHGWPQWRSQVGGRVGWAPP
jgi:hypothetical protein